MELGREKKGNNRVDIKIEIPCPHVPDEIVVQILSKLAVKSLLRCRCVSKSWLSIRSDPKFKLATQREQVIVMSRLLPTPIVNQFKFSIHLIDDEASVKELPLPKPLMQDLTLDGPRLRGSCNGLLLVSSGQNLFLWNPFTRCCNRVLSHYRLSNRRYGRLVVSGLCYDYSTDDYKTVMIFTSEGFVMVGSLRNKTWTKIRFPYNKENLKSGPTVNDRVHWSVCQGSKVEPYLIVSVNPQTNELVELPMPHDEQIKGTIVLGFGVLDGCLSLVLSNDNRRPDATEIEVLAMTKYGDKESWTSLFRVSDLLPFHPTFTLAVPLCSTTSGEVLMQWKAGQWVILACNPEHNWPREFPIPRIRNHIRRIYDSGMLVESLVSPRRYNWDEEENTRICIFGVTSKRKFIQLVFKCFSLFILLLLLRSCMLVGAPG